MNPALFSTVFAQALGMTLLHSIWQIVLIWLVFRALQRAFHQQHQTVYLLSLAAMSAALVWSGLTFAYYRELYAPVAGFWVNGGAQDLASAPVVSSPAAPLTVSIVERWWHWLEAYSALLGWVWVLCTGIWWLRLAAGLWMVQKLRYEDVIPVPESVADGCREWISRLHINTKTRVLESPHVSSPLTLGFWKPVILFPAGLLLQLSPAQVETLLLHELAHIRRYDYLVNLFQLALETLFFYHPLFWMISKETRLRRELCCDALVLRHSSDRILYARTLTNLANPIVQPSNPFVMKATGNSDFAKRIYFIAGMRSKPSLYSNWIILLLFPAMGLANVLWAGGEKNAMPAMETIQSPGTDSLPPAASNTKPATLRSRQVNPVDPQKLSPKPKIEAPAIPDGYTGQVAMELVKMNVFYIGITNPLNIAVAGVSPESLVVELYGNGEISGEKGQYAVRVNEPGEVKIRVSRATKYGVEWIKDQVFRVKQIPDPVPMLDGQYTSRVLHPDAMWQSTSIQPVFENMNIDIKCEVIGFEATYLPYRADPITTFVTGGRWNESLQNWVKEAKVGDAYFFDNIQVKCEGDAAPRNIGGIAFKIRE